MYEFTSESVSNGHPDKIADLISDTVATFIIDGNINNRAAVETLVTTNMVTVAGEYKSDKLISKEEGDIKEDKMLEEVNKVMVKLDKIVLDKIEIDD